MGTSAKSKGLTHVRNRQKIQIRSHSVWINDRLPLLAVVWIAIVGSGAFGLSQHAPESDAAGGVVLAAIALGGYKLTGWALDLLAPLLVERLVWPLLGMRRLSSGDSGPAFSSAFGCCTSGGRDIHFGKSPELKEEIDKSRSILPRLLANWERLARTQWAPRGSTRVSNHDGT